MATINLGRVGFVNKGTWSVATAYKINDVVIYNNGTYAALQAHTGQTPITGGSVYWQEWITSDNTAFVANAIHGATDKATPVDADELGIADSAATFGLKKLTWANLKATLLSSLGVMINSLTGKTTPVDADELVIADSAATNASKKLTVGNLKVKIYNEAAYDNDTTSFIANTLASGAIIERGSNANGEYVKYADGTLICNHTPSTLYTHSTTSGSVYYVSLTLTFPSVFIAPPDVTVNSSKNSGTGVTWAGGASLATTTSVSFWSIGSVLNSISQISYIAIGKWK